VLHLALVQNHEGIAVTHANDAASISESVPWDGAARVRARIAPRRDLPMADETFAEFKACVGTNRPLAIGSGPTNTCPTNGATVEPHQRRRRSPTGLPGERPATRGASIKRSRVDPIFSLGLGTFWRARRDPRQELFRRTNPISLNLGASVCKRRVASHDEVEHWIRT